MRRSVTYILTLISVGVLYFGSLYFMSRPSKGCLTPVVDGKSELMNSEQVPLFQEDMETEAIVIETAPIIEYSKIEIKPACKKLPLSAKREKAVIVVLVRNNELNAMRRTMREFEE